MKTRNLSAISLDILWEYREFKRDEVPAPKIPFMHMHGVDEITEHVRQNGLEPLELSIIGETALLTDGNHRIAAAKKLGYQNVPVFVMVYSGQERDIFYDHSLERFKPVTKDLEQVIKKYSYRT